MTDFVADPPSGCSERQGTWRMPRLDGGAGPQGLAVKARNFDDSFATRLAPYSTLFHNAGLQRVVVYVIRNYTPRLESYVRQRARASTRSPRLGVRKLHAFPQLICTLTAILFIYRSFASPVCCRAHRMRTNHCGMRSRVFGPPGLG